MAGRETPGYGDTIRLFVGLDDREAVAAHVFIQSVLDQTHVPVSVTYLTPSLGKHLGIEPEGTNSFGKLRFAVPYLCNWSGGAIFMDGDMLCRYSLLDLWKRREAWYGVQVVKQKPYIPQERKYIGTDLEADNVLYPMKNWSSVMLWSCDYFPHQRLTPDVINKWPAKDLHRFFWMPEERIGELTPDWNHLVGERPYDPDAKLAHFTLGIPGFEHYKRADYAPEWIETLKRAAKGLQYLGK